VSREKHPEEDAPSPAPRRGSDLGVLDSRDLLEGDREIAIRHGEEIYRLSVTRSGKLILHK
jgi:hemin uptake protein HemP